MTQLLDIFGFLSVLLRGLTLALQSLTAGGLVFLLCVARARAVAVPEASRRMLAAAALALAVTQSGYVAANSAILMETAGIGFGEVVGANFFLAGGATVLAALLVAALALLRAWRALPLMLLPAAVILGATVMTSHAAARVEHRLPLGALTALHLAATAAWVGGLPFLLVGLARSPDERAAEALARRFSRLALLAVAALAAAGVGLALVYIDSPRALYGTAYGAMVSAKVLLFGVLLLLGGLNFWVVRGLRADAGGMLRRLRSFAGAEVGIGFTVVLAAASLTSVPPAVDLAADRLGAAEIAARFAPRAPRLWSPASSELSTPTRQTLRLAAEAGAPSPESYVPGQAPSHPNTAADMAWSEYNHHWAGLVVLALGLLAVAARTGRAPWARNWPLVFLGLAVFLFLRADPENWPLGPNGFWESWLEAEVLQHRFFVLLIVAFAVFEWRVQTGRAAGRAALVFPLVCAVGGAVLLAHAHALGNLKEELLAELTHIPLALLGVVAGWSRWLELRLPPEDRRVPSWIWPVCFVLIGLVLLDYRES